MAVETGLMMVMVMVVSSNILISIIVSLEKIQKIEAYFNIYIFKVRVGHIIPRR